MLRVPDLVRDSKLDTHFHPKYVYHLHNEPSSQSERRTVTRTEYWKRAKRIGGGNYGQVWLEKCIKGQRDLSERAVKEIPKYGAVAGAIDYNRELEAIAKFSHPRYVRCFVESYGWYEQESTLFISMEYLPHGDLQTLLSDIDCLPEPDVRQIIFQVLEGLSLLHDNGFTHRDLKPSNILIKQKPPPADQWWIKIADFGISKRAEDGTTNVSTLKGTLSFMAPELHGFITDDTTTFPKDTLAAQQSVDMWALGEVACQLLTKERCFENMGVLARYAMSAAPFPSSTLQKRSVTDEGIDFISHAMRCSPSERLNAKQALDHPWVRALGSIDSRPTSPISIGSLDLSDTSDAIPPQLEDEPSNAWSVVSGFSLRTNASEDTTHVRANDPSKNDQNPDGAHIPEQASDELSGRTETQHNDVQNQASGGTVNGDEWSTVKRKKKKRTKKNSKSHPDPPQPADHSNIDKRHSVSRSNTGFPLGYNQVDPSQQNGSPDYIIPRPRHLRTPVRITSPTPETQGNGTSFSQTALEHVVSSSRTAQRKALPQPPATPLSQHLADLRSTGARDNRPHDVNFSSLTPSQEATADPAEMVAPGDKYSFVTAGTEPPSEAYVNPERTDDGIASPQETPSRNSIPKKALNVQGAFKKFLTTEEQRAKDVGPRPVDQKNSKKIDKELKFEDLRKFWRRFKLSTPVPKDLLPVLASDEAKQNDIFLKQLDSVERDQADRLREEREKEEAIRLYEIEKETKRLRKQRKKEREEDIRLYKEKEARRLSDASINSRRRYRLPLF